MAQPLKHVRFIDVTDDDRNVFAALRGPARAAFPRPKIAVVDRPGAFGLTEYVGHDPYELIIPIRFDKFVTGGSVEKEILDLEDLAERDRGTLEPPVLKIEGPIPHRTLKWRITGLEEVTGRTLYNRNGDRCRIAIDVTLLQHVTDTELRKSLARNGKAIKQRTTLVKAGENSLYDVARRVYKDPKRARDIARANPVKGQPMPLKTRLTRNRRLRLPS